MSYEAISDIFYWLYVAAWISGLILCYPIGLGSSASRFRHLFLLAAIFAFISNCFEFLQERDLPTLIGYSVLILLSLYHWWTNGGDDDFKKGKRKVKAKVKEVAGKLVVVPVPQGAPA